MNAIAIAIANGVFLMAVFCKHLKASKQAFERVLGLSDSPIHLWRTHELVS